MKNQIHSKRGEGEIAITCILVLIGLVLAAVGMAGCPMYSVYSAEKDGQAVLAHAQSSKEVAVAEAKAKLESATLLAQAEVERAKGVAQANQIIGNSLKDNEAYLRYLYIQSLENKQGEVIYVPTEAGLPILEAGRFGTRKP